MEQLQAIRGMKDLLGDEAKKFSYIIDIAREIAKNYCFAENFFPLLEEVEVFKRSLGDSSDVVTKEMYDFEDKSGKQITLRPEFTAQIMRSVISNSMYQELPKKIFTYGPLFRYERPQKARQRQFHQLNYEFIGNDSYLADFELIMMAVSLFEKLGIKDKLKLEINSLGCGESRNAYRNKLVEYFSKHKASLSSDSQKRLDTNPLRILDSKDEADKKIIKDAPEFSESYTESAKKYFKQLLEMLDKNNVEYFVNKKLVRGLDYYSHTVFEFTTDLLGSQNAVAAGGRYDDLILQLGGKKTASIGFAAGVERIMCLLDDEIEDEIKYAVVPVSDAQINDCYSLLQEIRSNKVKAEIVLGKSNFSKRMQKAQKLNPQYVVIYGADELLNNEVRHKNLATSVEVSESKDNFIASLRE